MPSVTLHLVKLRHLLESIMFRLFALSVVTAGLDVYYRDSYTNSYGCLGHSGLIFYVECGKTLCPVSHTGVDLRQCSNDSGPANRSDTWLDAGCSLLGGGCTRRFIKSKGDKPWCVPVGWTRMATMPRWRVWALSFAASSATKIMASWTGMGTCHVLVRPNRLRTIRQWTKLASRTMKKWTLKR